METKTLIKELKSLGACVSLSSNETFEGVCSMITSHRGASFCTDANAPSLKSWRDKRLQDNVDVKQHVRLDTTIDEKNVERIVLVNCKGILRFNLNRSAYVYLLHGSDVQIKAGGFASVHVFSSDDSKVSVCRADNAIVML